MGVRRTLPKQGETETVIVVRRSEESPRIARLFHRWRQITPPDRASAPLNEAISLLQPILPQAILLAGAGFVSLELPYPTQNRFPDEAEFAAIVKEARQAAQTVRDTLPGEHPTLCFGVDVLATCARSQKQRQLGQFAAILQPGQTDIHLIGKGFPTILEESYLRILDRDNPIAAHIFGIPLGSVAILVCHDINVYSPRGERTTENQYRKDWRNKIQQEVADVHPVFAFHLAHYIETPRSFLQAYGAWAAKVAIPLIGVSGLDAGIDLERASELAAALLTPRDWPTIDLWAR